MLTLARMRQNMDLETYRADWLRMRDRFAEMEADPEPQPESRPASPDVEGGEGGLDAIEDALDSSDPSVLQHYGEAMESAGDLVAPTADPEPTSAPEEHTALPSE